MRLSGWLLVAAVAGLSAGAWGAPTGRESYIGYVYPAGGQHGTVVDVTVGGRGLRGVNSAIVSGDGVRAVVVDYGGPLGNKQVGDIGAHLRVLMRQRIEEMSGKRGTPPPAAAPKPPAPVVTSPAAPAATSPAAPAATKPPAPDEELPPLPDHPWVRNLDKMSLKELDVLRARLTDRKRQPNAQIAEMVIVRITLDPGATPGDRELRLCGSAGLTNPLCFQVGGLPETREQEPNEKLLAITTVAEPPLLLNGQIMPGDVDRFRLRARQGQKLVLTAQARHLIPYLADAVPGWFQAVLSLTDATGKEVAFADDYRFDPDPVLLYQVPQDGEYVLEIRDSIYRGRDDFVYRLTVGEQPFITRFYPLGGREGVATTVALAGWNLPTPQVQLDTAPGAGATRQTTWLWDQWLSNRISYAVDTLPECEESEPNDTPQNAQRLSLPQVVNGRIARPGDVDVFRLEGRAGDTVVAEVNARRLGSPLDSLLRLADATGRTLAWNDDHEDKATGLLTHHADSYLSVRLPADGVYTVQLTEAQHHGGEEYSYRLRLGPRRPDFALRATPSGLALPTGITLPIAVYALRQDGFDGDIELSLKDAPIGFRLGGGRIPAGRESVRVTLTSPADPLERPVVLKLEGRAVVAGQTITRPVVAAEDLMQAFAYRHLVPSRELLVTVNGRRRVASSAQLADPKPVRIPAGGSALVPLRIATPRPQALQILKVELSDPPRGVSLQSVAPVPGGLTLVLKAEAGVKVGYADNLIAEAFIEWEDKPADGKPGRGKQRLPLGVLPAISFEIVPGH